MVSLQIVRANNSDLKKLGSGLVAVFGVLCLLELLVDRLRKNGWPKR